MQDKYKKYMSGIFISIIALVLASYIIYIFGGFDFFFLKKLNYESREILKKYNEFVKINISHTKNISKDDIIVNALIQSQFDENIFSALKQINIYMGNYKDIKRLSVFDYKYRIVVASDMKNYSVNSSVKPEWFLLAGDKDYFLSDVYFDQNLKTYLFTIVVPIKNFVDEVVGYVTADIDMRGFLEFLYGLQGLEIGFFKDKTFFFSLSNSEVNSIDAVKKIYKFSKMVYFEPQNMYLVIGASDRFTSLFFQFQFLFYILAAVFFLIGFYYLLDKILKLKLERQKKIRDSVKKVIEQSKKINVENISVLEDIDTAKSKDETEEDIEKFIQEREEKLTKEKKESVDDKKSEIKKKVEDEFKDDFIIIE